MAKEFVPENTDMRELKLLWHQEVGVAAIAAKLWTKEITEEGVPGVLIADEVGVGKTALTMGLMAFIIDAYWVQEAKAGRAKPDGATMDLTSKDVRNAPLLGKCCDV
jgi:hypothetical protein